ncbi:MAG: hypothetical protein PHH70_03835 [Candidatus Gracilibacteria bacterium]|nr:hypothetical protein [Candidatus Gracilibacteria bacterium]
MKYLFSCICFLCVAVSQVSAGDYFEENILESEPEMTMLQDIALNPVTFSDYTETKRYRNTSAFLFAIKTEAGKQFHNGSIPLYRRYDIITNLDSFVYTMNQYFFYQKKYEQTKKSVFKDSARSYLQDSRGTYDRLKASLKNSTY